MFGALAGALLIGLSQLSVHRGTTAPARTGPGVTGIAATAVFAFVLIWNEFLMANLLVGPKSLTATVGVWIGGGEHAGSYKPIDWDELNAAAGLALIPALTIVLAIRKYLARAFTLGVAR